MEFLVGFLLVVFVLLAYTTVTWLLLKWYFPQYSMPFLNVMIGLVILRGVYMFITMDLSL